MHKSLRVVRVDRVIAARRGHSLADRRAFVDQWAPDSKQFAVRSTTPRPTLNALISSANGRRNCAGSGVFCGLVAEGSREDFFSRRTARSTSWQHHPSGAILVQGFGALWSPSGARIAFSASTYTACSNDYRLFSVDGSARKAPVGDRSVLLHRAVRCSLGSGLVADRVLRSISIGCWTDHWRGHRPRRREWTGRRAR